MSDSVVAISRESHAALSSWHRSDVVASYAECNRIARAREAASISRFSACARKSATRSAPSTPSCGWWTTSRTSRATSNRSAAGLAHWRALLDEAAAGRTDGHAILPALADTIARFEIPTRYFHDLILGAEMDLTVASYATFDRLSEYCYRVAGTVGLTCLHVFGFRDPRAPDLAERLGLAFQLTNILRDVQADYEMGRVYLPLEDLARFGVREQDLRGPVDAAASRSARVLGAIARGVFMKKARRSSRKWTRTAERLCGR